jgi:N-methylhydantoinase A/oxoprolinase/acetone carboxylase beta subunit
MPDPKFCQVCATPLEWIESLEDGGLKGPLLVMQSEGGTITADRAPEHAITTIGSVLSGGVIGGMRLAEQLGHRNVITTDVGGTTFLAGLIVLTFLRGRPWMVAALVLLGIPAAIIGWGLRTGFGQSVSQIYRLDGSGGRDIARD